MRDMLEELSNTLDHPIVCNNVFVHPSKRFSTLVDNIKEGDKLLDIGCGVGTLLEGVIERYPYNEVWGVDISDVAIEKCKEKIPNGVFFPQHVGSLDKVPDDYFDVVFSGEVIEHLEDPSLLFKDAYRVLKGGGRFIVTTPNDKTVNSLEHVWFITEDDITKFYEDAGFSDVEFIKLPELERMIIIFATGIKCPKK